MEPPTGGGRRAADPDARRGETFTHLVLVEGLSTALLGRLEGDMRAILEGAGARDVAAASYALDFELLSPGR